MAIVRDHRVLVQRRDGKGMREVVNGGRRRFTKARAQAIAATLKKRGRNARIQKVLTPKQKNDLLIKKWLRGDLDFDRKLMVRLARAARDSRTVLHVNYGKRTYAEQTYLWNKYGPPRAARPGTSRHETGLAADVVTRLTRRNVGSVASVRAAMKKHGVCLPVPGEPWHVELGTTWRA